MGQKMEQGQERTDLSGPEFKTLKAKGERQKLLTKKSEYESIQYEKKDGKRMRVLGAKDSGAGASRAPPSIAACQPARLTLLTLLLGSRS